MASRKVVVVTGSNKGIGYGLVESLCEKFDGDVYLTSRDIKRGEEAVEKLRSRGFSPLFHQLDITDQKSVDKFRDYLKSKYGGIDILINNAAILLWNSDDNQVMEAVTRDTINTNYYGTKRVCDALFPLLRKDGRVVNISSDLGHLSQINAADLRAKLNNENITVNKLDKLIDHAVRDAAEGKIDKWSTHDKFAAYVVSKVGLSCLTQIQQRIFDAETPNRNISVNSVHPGYIDTDMTAELKKTRPNSAPIEEGIKAPLFLALQANLKGKYVWKDCQVVDWDAPSLEGLSTP